MAFPTRAGDRRLPSDSVLRRVALGGALLAAAVVLGGAVVQRVGFGADDEEGRRRVEAEVRAEFDAMARGLRDVVAAAADPSVMREAGTDVAANRRLFDAVGTAIQGGGDARVALTAYSKDGLPLAWAGRPSELPRGRLMGGEAWFLLPSAVGLRLVYVRPVEDEAGRLGMLAVERTVPRALEPSVAAGALGAARPDVFRFPTRLAAVAIEPAMDSENAFSGAETFQVETPTGDPLLTAMIAASDLALTRGRWQQATTSISLLVLAAAMLLMAGPLLDLRRRGGPLRYAGTTLLVVGLVVLAREIVRAASLADWSGQPVFSGGAYASPLLAPLLTSPFDFLATAATWAAIVAAGAVSLEAWRVRTWSRRRHVRTAVDRWIFLGAQACGGSALALVLVAHEAVLRDTVRHSTLDLLRFSLLHWDTARMALQVGLIVAHATALALAVMALRAAMSGFCVPRAAGPTRLARIVAWMLPLVAWLVTAGVDPMRVLPLLLPAVVAVLLALVAPLVAARYRHGSQAFRLTMMAVGLIMPTCAFYPTVFHLAREARSELVETRYAPQAIRQRQTVQAQLEDSLAQIDRFEGLGDLVVGTEAPGTEALTDRAFRVWQTTALSTFPATSSVELYGRDGALVSRFAFNLPEDLTATPPSVERACGWDVYEEVAPFFGVERRVLHAGRAICGQRRGDPPLGSIEVHAMPDDYENLPFLASRSPYVELLRPADPLRGEGLSERGVEYAVYGWSRTPLYASGATPWVLPDDVFARVEQSRRPFWTDLARGAERHDVYLLNDRGGIYALGFPVVPALGHLVNLAEITVLAIGTFLLLLVGRALFRALGGRRLRAPGLLREVRTSFYRKLFLAFVAAVILPVVLLAVATRNYVADQVRANIEQEAIRTAAAAGRVVENLVAPRASQPGVRVDDNLMVFVSRLIDQDVNIFAGGRLLATSERNLYASGLLPTRTPAEIHHALELRYDAAAVVRERIGPFEYLVAATPLTAGQFTGLLTLPLPSRQQEIDQEIDTLDRRVLLAALLFILGGAGLGYSMAERISDPVNRLSRATRRIARGDLDARTVATSSDELGRLVEDFNSMAGELQRQRTALERTHRVEAWAEMARQVAHEIKNPLTPIQLNAEHLRRVHADRGEPLGPVLTDCVATILTQVKLLRQIASEFSNFASSPTARPSEVDVSALVGEIVAPYQAGLSDRVEFTISVPPSLPPVYVDRLLIGRSITNLIENALHAMPGRGTLSVTATADANVVRLRVADTGSGMDSEALARAFEPYFSTKTGGTGLGLPIAKRNVELSGGTIAITSERERGTAVEVELPVSREAARLSG